MIEDKKILAVITARGGSKGLVRKNVLEVGGQPLIAWTIQAAKESRYLDRVILSSDDGEIIRVAQKFGCEAPFVRPAELARDESSSEDVLIHALDEAGEGYDILVLLQPTSPLRRAEDIDACLEIRAQTKAPACVSVSVADKSPYWMYSLDDENRLRPLLMAPNPATRRQDLPPVYALNGAVYAADISWFRRHGNFISGETAASIMPEERSLDVDTALDLLFAEAVMASSSLWGEEVRE